MKLILTALALVILSPAAALAQQQPAPSQTPSQTALQVVAIISSWAQTIEGQHQQVATLQAQLAAAQARVKELEDGKAKQEAK
jgi:TolA-binding protein